MLLVPPISIFRGQQQVAVQQGFGHYLDIGADGSLFPAHAAIQPWKNEFFNSPEVTPKDPAVKKPGWNMSALRSGTLQEQP
ncbi:hypothetical protein IWQ54_002683 [Labrenzia sp. EL_195]|uniref:hypothetical protein n=1 Tax=Roseibium album TaxID=311410 RepID=UPI0006DC7AAB|nr:hypothetical protein [Roseibium album]MBG6163020.1 hypothetical protein [Labrenzia sp. EL_195]